jgi:AraC-like DNA-binding protein
MSSGLLSGHREMAADSPREFPANSTLPFLDPCRFLDIGNCWEYRIQDGFRMSRLDISPEKQVRLAYEKDTPTLNFGFIMSGNYVHRIKAPGFNGQELSNHAGGSGIVYMPRQDGELVIPGRMQVSVVHIHLSLPVFHDLFRTDPETVPKALKPLLDGPVDRSYAFRSGISMETRSALDRLVAGPPPQTPARLFYQGIALALIAGQISRANTSDQPSGPLGRDDKDRVIQARDLLVRDLISPPCLKQLSRKTGLNMNKLQQGFYRLYGVSVFKYLHRHRMLEANRIFHETDMNVSQAASAVGYTNVSHFSRAYKKHFNVLPKKHLTAIKR